MNILYKEDSTGVTDWQQSVGRPLRTAGCLLFLCTAGRAVVSVNMQKKPLRCGSLLVVTQDMFASPRLYRLISRRAMFRCRTLHFGLLIIAYRTHRCGAYFLPRPFCFWDRIMYNSLPIGSRVQPICLPPLNRLNVPSCWVTRLIIFSLP